MDKNRWQKTQCDDMGGKFGRKIGGAEVQEKKGKRKINWPEGGTPGNVFAKNPANRLSSRCNEGLKKDQARHRLINRNRKFQCDENPPF